MANSKSIQNLEGAYCTWIMSNIKAI